MKEAMEGTRPQDGPASPPPELPLWSPECGKARNVRGLAPGLAVLLRGSVTGSWFVTLGLSFPICETCTMTSIPRKCHKGPWDDYVKLCNGCWIRLSFPSPC